MHQLRFVRRLCNGNAAATAEEYPNRRHPDNRIFIRIVTILRIFFCKFCFSFVVSSVPSFYSKLTEFSEKGERHPCICCPTCKIPFQYDVAVYYRFPKPGQLPCCRMVFYTLYIHGGHLLQTFFSQWYNKYLV